MGINQCECICPQGDQRRISVSTYSEPPSVFLKNNKSAKIHREFVTEAVLELIATERVQEVPAPSYVVNPLSVSVKGSDRRLILDLRHVNLHVFKSKIKFDDWRVMEDLVETGGYLFKFDLKQGYHHVDIHPEFQKYLGFSWIIGGTQRYFVFSVLPFGLTTPEFVYSLRLYSWTQGRVGFLWPYLDDKGKG